jgi:peptidoglycan hydrolase-like protein with peptidoglycan-binding domain
VPVTSNPAINRTDVAAVALNVTVTDPLAAGYVTLGPAGSNDPTAKTRPTATVSVVRSAQTLPSHAIVGVSPRGFDVFSLSGAHVVADVTGYYLGSPSPAPFGPAANVDPTIAGCAGFADLPVGQVITGSSKAAVMRVQQRLLELGFWLFTVDGQFGHTTSQAVMAFQKYHGLPSSSAVDEATAVKLNSSLCRATPGASATGDLLEVDKGKQLLFIVRGGKAQWVLNTSTGGNYVYEYTDKRTGQKGTDTAVTPNGNHKVYRVSDEVRYESTLGILYRPRFVVGGVAVHGYSSIPNYPASHGCIRVSNSAMDLIWGQNYMPMNSRVWIHD